MNLCVDPMLLSIETIDNLIQLHVVCTVCVWTDLCPDLILISKLNLIGRGGIVHLE